MRFVRGENLKGRHIGCRHWGVGNDGRIWNLLEKTQCERGGITQRKWRIYFPVADGRIKLPGGDQDLRTSTLIRQRPIRGESRIDFLGESEGSLPSPQDSFPDAGEAINDFWSMSGNFKNRHHWTQSQTLLAKRRIIPYSTEIHCLQNYTNLDVKQVRRIDDCWNIDGSRDLSDSWTDFTQSPLEEKPPNGFLWSGRRLTRKQLTSRPDYGQNSGRNWEEMPSWRRGKTKVVTWKPKLDNARKLRGIYFIGLRTRNSKIPFRIQEKMETPMGPVMPCKTCKKNKHRETRSKTNETKSKLACILEANESTRLRMEEPLPNHHEDHIAGKGDNSLQHFNLVHKFIPMLQGMKSPAAKAAVDKE